MSLTKQQPNPTKAQEFVAELIHTSPILRDLTEHTVVTLATNDHFCSFDEQERHNYLAFLFKVLRWIEEFERE